MENTLATIRKNWILIITLVSVIVTWTTFGLRLTALEIEARETKSKLEQIHEIKQDVAIIKVNVEFIKDKLNNIE